MMKKIVLLAAGLASLLSACSVREDVTELYKKESPVEAAILLPEDASQGTETIEVSLTQEGEPVDDAQVVHMEVWKQDGSVSYGMTEMDPAGDGMYSYTESFPEDGLYYVQLHVEHEGQMIIPKKQFVVGELTEEDLEFLHSGEEPPEVDHEDHH